MRRKKRTGSGTTKAELQSQVDALQARNAELTAAHEQLKKDNASLLETYDRSVKAVKVASEEAALAKENLARAMGYIDRINDQERPEPPPTPIYQAQVKTPTGPVLRAPPQPDGYRSYR